LVLALALFMHNKVLASARWEKSYNHAKHTHKNTLKGVFMGVFSHNIPAKHYTQLEAGLRIQ
jgi:hypothetical protein